MSVVLMDSVSVSGKKFFLSKERSITTNYAEAEKFSNMKKAMNFLNSMPKALKRYRFTAIYSEALDPTNLKDKDIALLQKVLGPSTYLKNNIPKVKRKNEHFTEFTRTLEDVERIENEIKEVDETINIPTYRCSAPTEYSIEGATKYIEELQNHINEFKVFFNRLTLELAEKKEQMSICDKKISSLNHLLEFYGERMNACEHYKISNEIDQIVKSRRILKNEIAIGKKIKECFDMSDMLKKVIKEYEDIKYPTYNAEYYQDWFAAKANRRSII